MKKYRNLEIPRIRKTFADLKKNIDLKGFKDLKNVHGLEFFSRIMKSIKLDFEKKIAYLKKFMDLNTSTDVEKVHEIFKSALI